MNVISREEASAIGMKWCKSKIKLRPYGSKPLRVCGRYTGSIMFKDNIVDTDIYIVKENLETLISGETAETLGVISLHDINMV